MIYEFTVNHKPMGAPRMTRQDKWKQRDCVVRYREFKDAIRAAIPIKPATLLTGPLRVEIVFVMPRQKSKMWKTKSMPRYRSCTKPDIDNMVKACLDCLNQVIWIDDSQVAEGVFEKWHCAGSESPHLTITVASLD